MVSQLVERIRQKDQRAMSQLYQLYVEELSSVCYRYVPSEDDAKDVLQNSFVKIFTSIPTFEYRGEGAFKAWMKQVVANEALSFFLTLPPGISGSLPHIRILRVLSPFFDS